MKKYNIIDVSERQLEDLVRQDPDLIEDGLNYLDHQKGTDRGPLDVLMADSGGALIVCELKIVEDDGMLFQGIDYYDYVTRNIDAFTRLYKDHKIDPFQAVRLFLIAPSFSISLLNRLKWIDIPISLFTFNCIQFENEKEIIPVYSEITIPSAPVVLLPNTLEDKLNYITDSAVRKLLQELLKEIKSWDENNISIDPVKYDLSLKKSGTVFSYIGPRRKHFVIYTYDRDDEWVGFPIYQKSDLVKVKDLLKHNIVEE